MDANELNRLPNDAALDMDPELTSESISSDPEEVHITYIPKQNKEEVVNRLLEISLDPCSADKQELDLLKQNFYKLLKAEQEAQKAAEEAKAAEGASTEAAPAEADADAPKPDHEAPDVETRFKEVWAAIKEKRNEMKAEDKKEKEENVAKKLALIDRLRALADSKDDSNRQYAEFKKIQQEWNDIKNVPTSKMADLWRLYQQYAEKFYDLVKLNNEFREYDFRKNLEIKTHLCEAAEKLSEEPDVVSAFHQLQKLHQEFRATGPVAKELREDIWTRFKTASSSVNRRHQQHFEQLKEKEQHNLDEKTVICEIAEQMEYDTFTTFQQWEDKTQEILALQAKWKNIGYAPQKMNVKIFERFRASCDEFFRRKALFYKSVKETMAANLEKKKELCAKAEALKDSTEWRATADALAQLQKEWKTVGPVPKKHSDAVWKRFITACDYFFDQKNRASDSVRTAEQENLLLKKEVVDKLEALAASDETGEPAQDKLRELMKEWNHIGHVPFKEKDKMYKLYHGVVDKLFEKLNMTTTQRRLSRAGLSKTDLAFRERERLVKMYESMKAEIQTYENNLGFLDTSSESGDSLASELTRKVGKLKSELELVLRKIQAIDDAQKADDEAQNQEAEEAEGKED
jgi:hypothetical protein